MIGKSCILKHEFQFSGDAFEFIIPRGRTGKIDRICNGGTYLVKFDMGNNFIRFKVNSNEIDIENV